MEASANPLALTLLTTPQPGGLASSLQTQVIDLEGKNEFLAALQLMLGDPPPRSAAATVALNATPSVSVNPPESTPEDVALPVIAAIIASPDSGERQITAGPLPLPMSLPVATAIPPQPSVSLDRARKPGVSTSVDRSTPVPNVISDSVESSKLDALSASSLRLINTTPLPAGADTPGTLMDTLTRELSPGSITNLTGSGSGTGSSDSQIVRTSVGTPISQTPGQTGWDNALGQRILWMTGQQVKEATLQLNPPEMGKIQVRVSIDGDQASVNFISQHANVREAIDNALPRLREMLGADGLTLADASVNDQRQANTDRHSAERPDQSQVEDEESRRAATLNQISEESIVTHGLVDFYA